MKLALTSISKLEWELELKFGRCMEIVKAEPRLINDISSCGVSSKPRGK